MSDDNSHITPTLAKTLQSQGHLKEAAEAYAYLLSQTPGHVGFREALQDVRNRLAEKRTTGDTLPALFEQWIGLTLTYVHLQRCKKLRTTNARLLT